MTDYDPDMMRRALSLARKGVGKTAPNPAVGCVIAQTGAIVGTGWHRRAGTPHAEIHALAEAGDRARGADVYVTLEPCAHYGKTPPCAEALVASGVGRVFAGMIDPNPKVSGRGIEMLRNAGIEVFTGLLEAECRLLNEPFIKHTITGMPFVILKCALTLDGKIATATGDSRWITNEKSRCYVHKIRGLVDAVMVGSGTVTADNPELTCRIPRGKDPVRVVIDTRLTIPTGAKLYHLTSPAKTIVATLSTDQKRIGELQRLGAEIVQCRDRDGRVDLADLLCQLGARGVQSVLIEGGGTLAGDALRTGLVDKFLFFYAPKLVGGDAPGPFSGPGVVMMSDAMQLRTTEIRKFGDDLLLTAYPERSCLPA